MHGQNYEDDRTSPGPGSLCSPDAGCFAFRAVAARATRRVKLVTADADHGIAERCRDASHQALRQGRPATASAADGLQLANDVRSSNEFGHDGERFPAKVEVESGDHDLRPPSKVDHSVGKITLEELRFVDSDKLVPVRNSDELTAVSHAHRMPASTRVADDLVGPPRVDARLYGDHRATAYLDRSKALEEKLCLPGEHRPSDELEQTTRTIHHVSLAPVFVGTSGWAYPSWKPGFYPAGTASSDFLRFYAERFPTVELNTTGYRLPAEEHFDRWAEQTPPGFTFAPKLPAQRPQVVAEFSDRVRRLGDRLGPVRVSIKSPRDEGLVELLLGSLDPSLRLAFDLEDPSWDGIEPRLAEAGAVRVNDLETRGPFRYVRLREPPYSDDELRAWADRIRGASGPTFVYLRHEDEPTAPRYAERLRELLA